MQVYIFTYLKMTDIIFVTCTNYNCICCLYDHILDFFFIIILLPEAPFISSWIAGHNTLGTDTVPGWQHGSVHRKKWRELCNKTRYLQSPTTQCACVSKLWNFFYKFCKLRMYKINRRSIIWLFPILVSFHISFHIFHTLFYSQPNPWYDKHFVFPSICIQIQVWNMHWDPREVTMIALIRPMPMVCMEYMYLQF